MGQMLESHVMGGCRVPHVESSMLWLTKIQVSAPGPCESTSPTSPYNSRNRVSVASSPLPCLFPIS